MSFRSIIRDVRDSIGNLSRRSSISSVERKPGGDKKGGKTRGSSSVQDSNEEDRPVVVEAAAMVQVQVQDSPWASLPAELLRDVIRRLEESETTWPCRKNVVACASVCRSWRDICKEIVPSLELSGKLTFPVSLKQPGTRDAMIQCFIKRDKSNLTYHLYLCLSPALLVENGKFLLSAKRTRRTTHTEYVISMNADTISRSSNTYIGKIRSNFLGTKFIIYDTQPPYNYCEEMEQRQQPGRSSRRFYSKKVSPKVPSGNYSIAQVSYELNVLGTRGPRRMHCAMNSVPASCMAPGGIVPGQPEILPRSLEDSFRSVFSSSYSSSAKITRDYSTDFNSARFSEILDPRGDRKEEEDEDGEGKERFLPLVLKNKSPRWHEQLQCWCLNFRGRVTVASVKNFQLIAAANQVAAAAQPGQSDQDKIILQFGKVGKDMFTMDFKYPLSAFQAFAICLSSFDTKLACE